MVRIVLFTRTTKTAGDIKVRLRLTDGRRADIFHSTDIKGSIADLGKFTPEGNLKPKVSVYNRNLLDSIKQEIEYMKQAYEEIEKMGMDKTSEVMDSLIAGYKNPIVAIREDADTIITRFHRYISEALRDGIIGGKRSGHITVVADKLERFLIIKGLSHMTAKEFDDQFLLEFRNFIYDEYMYVPKHKRLYKDIKSQNLPSERLSTNTVVSQMKMLHTFFNELENNDEITKSPFRKLSKEKSKAVMKTKYDDPIFLRQDEFTKLLKFKTPPFLSDVRDAFLVQCAFGCRIGDFQNMTMDNVSVSEDGIPYIHYLPHKTADSQFGNTEVVTPIVRFAFDIIKRTGFSFPIIRNTYGQSGYNVRIKSLLDTCGIKRKVPVYDESKKDNVYLSISELGSSKLCRKTHVDMLNKVQIDLYAAGLHKTGSSAVQRYTAMEMKDRFALINIAFGQNAYRVDEELNIIGK